MLIFVEKNVDKRNKVYKAVSSCGYVTEMKYQTPAMLKKWIAGMLSKEHYKVTEAACDLILEKTGANMELIRNEVNKLISYCAGRDAVMPQDVEAVCSTQTTSRIFEMIEAVAGKTEIRHFLCIMIFLSLKSHLCLFCT